MRELIAVPAVVTSRVDEGAGRCAGCGHILVDEGSGRCAGCGNLSN